MKESIPPSWPLRVGFAALGLPTGLLFGLVLAVLALVTFKASPSFPLFVFGGGAMGVVIGLAAPEAAWRIVQGTVHFLFGFVFTLGHQEIQPDRDAPQWLRVFLWVGVGSGLAAYIYLR